MADTRLSKVGVTVKEPWAVDISYEALDMTLFAVEDGGDGCSYVALKDNIGVTPGTDPATWVKSTQAGQSIYDLAVKYHHFEGTEEEFEAEYQAVLQAARDAAAGASAVESQVEEAEAARVAAESARVSAEAARGDAETARQTAETSRATAETARQSAESNRGSAETTRHSAETTRESAETTRQSNESARESAELTRTQQFQALKADMQTAIQNVDAKAAEIAEDIEGYEQNEAGRVSAEQGRVAAETARAQQSASDHTRAESDHTTATSDHQQAGSDHTRAEADHTTASEDHTTAASDHSTAGTDHTRAEQDHTTAESDHGTAESDHTRAESDHAIVQGYDTRLTNVEGEVSQLGQEVGDILSDYSLVQYANLFDKTAVTGGAAVRKDNGNLYNSANDSYSDYLEVPSGVASLVMTPQTLGGVKGWAAYDSSKQFKHGAAANVITFQEGDAYFRITVNTANLNTTMLVEGSSSSDLPSEYIPYGSAWERKPIPGADLTNGSVTKEKIGQSVWDEVVLLTSEVTNLPVDYTYSNFIIPSEIDNRDIIALDGYDVVIFYVGYNKKFHVTGTCANVYTGCALLVEKYSGITKLFRVTGGGYDYYGETTATQPYVAISVTHGTAFSCEVLEAAADVVKAIDKKTQDARPVIRIYKTDTEVEILTKLIAAYTNGNTDVIWENGTYIFAEVYQYMISELGWSWTMELPIGNNCRYYFNGSTIISNQPSGTYEESRNILGCKAGVSNKMDYELYDGILINNGGTYCVHDECARGTNPYIHKYVNMRMYYNKVEGLTQNISKCIGGGCGVNGTVIIENCLFVSDATNVEVSWHGKQNEENPAYFALFVDGCYFGRGLAISSHFKATDKVFVKYSNNASRDALAVDSTPESDVYAFNNSTHE